MRIVWLSFVMILLTISACVDDPLDGLKKELAIYDEYSVVLEDMEESDNYPGFFHKYKIVGIKHPPSYSKEMQAAIEKEAKPEITRYTTDWKGLSEDQYRKHQNDLGMTILSKDKQGNIRNVAEPAGYQYVGNPAYGRWATNSSGGSFWQFYGQYRLMSDVFGLFRRPVYRNDWDHYNDYRGSSRPYYGRNNQWGTNGSQTKKSKPNFYARRKAKEVAKQQSFSNRFRNRVNRSSSGYRSRSSGFGK